MTTIENILIITPSNIFKDSLYFYNNKESYIVKRENA